MSDGSSALTTPNPNLGANISEPTLGAKLRDKGLSFYKRLSGGK